jgi:hypothetical protein
VIAGGIVMVNQDEVEEGNWPGKSTLKCWNAVTSSYLFCCRREELDINL